MRSQDDDKPNIRGPKANPTALDHDPAKPDDVLKPVDPTAVSWIELMEQESIDAQENPAHVLPDFDDVSLDFAMVDSLQTDPTTTAAPGPPKTTLTEDELEAISIDTASPEDELEALVNRSELLEQGHAQDSTSLEALALPEQQQQHASFQEEHPDPADIPATALTPASPVEHDALDFEPAPTQRAPALRSQVRTSPITQSHLEAAKVSDIHDAPTRKLPRITREELLRAQEEEEAEQLASEPDPTPTREALPDINALMAATPSQDEPFDSGPKRSSTGAHRRQTLEALPDYSALMTFGRTESHTFDIGVTPHMVRLLSLIDSHEAPTHIAIHSRRRGKAPLVQMVVFARSVLFGVALGRRIYADPQLTHGNTALMRQLAPYVNKSIYGTLPLDIPRLLRMFQDLNAEDNSDLLLDLTLNTLLRCARVLPNEDELDVRATPLQQPRLDDVVAFDVATLMRGCSNLVGLNAPLGTFSDRFLRATRSKAQSIRQLYRLRDPVDAWLPYGSDDPISALELQQLIQALRATADLHIALAPPGLMTHVILTNALWCVIIDNARALVLKYPIQHATWAVDALNTIKLDAAREHSS